MRESCSASVCDQSSQNSSLVSLRSTSFIMERLYPAWGFRMVMCHSLFCSAWYTRSDFCSKGAPEEWKGCCWRLVQKLASICIWSCSQLALPIALIIWGAVMQNSSHLMSWLLMMPLDSLEEDAGIKEVEPSGTFTFIHMPCHWLSSDNWCSLWYRLIMYGQELLCFFLHFFLA